ncbi:MAG: right-handed parallel beta-helix repeat-containing protein [Thermogutta sp.]
MRLGIAHGLLCGVCFLMAQSAVNSKEINSKEIVIYVSPRGNDASMGTADQPLASLARAMDIVRDIRRSKGNQVDVRVQLAEGIYRVAEPVTISADHSPGPGKLIICAEPEKQVVISGGQRVTGWTQVGNRFETTVPEVAQGRWDFRELFVNDRRATRARSPNDKFVRIDKPGQDRRTSLFVYPQDAEIFKANLSAAEFVYLHDWSTSRVRIAGFDPQTLEVKFSQVVGCAAPHYAIGNWPHARYFLENSEDFLDAAGEWFVDKETGTLIYLPRPGESVDALEVVAPVASALLKVTGDEDSGKSVAGLVVEGIAFEHCRFDLPAAGYAAGQATVYEPRVAGKQGREIMPAAVTLNLVRDTQFVGCQFRHLGSSGLWLRQQCRQCRIERCVFEDISGNGINIGETTTRPQPSTPGDWSSPYNNACTWRITVCDNRITYCGTQFYEAVGIWVGIAAQNLIEHNEIAHLPYTGISVGWSWNDSPTGCRDNVVARNHIHHCMLILHDGGGIYTLGRQPGTRLVANVIHDIPPNEDGAESNGIFMDEGSSDIVVEGQTVFNTGRSPLRFHRALEITLRENLLVCLPGVPPYRYNRTDPNTLRFEGDRVIEVEAWNPSPEILKNVGVRK